MHPDMLRTCEHRGHGASITARGALGALQRANTRAARARTARQRRPPRSHHLARQRPLR